MIPKVVVDRSGVLYCSDGRHVTRQLCNALGVGSLLVRFPSIACSRQSDDDDDKNGRSVVINMVIDLRLVMIDGTDERRRRVCET